MRSAAILVGLLFCAPVWATDAMPVAKFKGWEGPKPEKAPCECRGRNGSKVGLGAKMCMQRGEQLVTMQCRLVLNNTAWQKVEDGCDVAGRSLSERGYSLALYAGYSPESGALAFSPR